MNPSDLDDYNFYKYENEVKKGFDNIMSYILTILETKGIDKVIKIIKSSGIAVSLYGDKRTKEIYNKLIDTLLPLINDDEKEKVNSLVTEAKTIEDIVAKFNLLRSTYFDIFEKEEDKYQVVSYLLSLERFLNTINKDTDTSEKFNLKVSLWDSAIESTGMILKYFMFNDYDFCGSNKVLRVQQLDNSSKHIFFSTYWNAINDIIEYWKYSKVNVLVDIQNKINFEIEDDEFELNNLISNERFVNLREGWQMSAVGEIMQEGSINELSNQLEKLTYLFSTLYFGTPTLEEMIENIKLSRWIKAYQLLINESKKFISAHTSRADYRIKKYCISKTKKRWKDLYKKNGFSSIEFETVFKIFTFNNKSQDIMDCPFIKIDDQFIIIPSLMAYADPARAISSNFLNRNCKLNFKGAGFEDRLKAGFKINNIKSSPLYKRVSDTEYECDVAFVVENDIFFVECKAHVQPYTTRQHANHLYKLYKETSQINRIADFYSNNPTIIKDQLNLGNDFQIGNYHRILITTSMIGTPLCVNGVYIVDESSFSMFVDRTPPSLMLIEEGVFKQQFTQRFDIYHGEITVNKIIDFLKSPPQIEILKSFYSKRVTKQDLYDISRYVKTKKTVYMRDEINDLDNELLNKYYSEEALQ
ncbi:hypothetical protein MJ749_17470 [Paenibacillus polymyxa]|uniref:hypothetical protein n=1 Tax=Paenibacillus polymyxa TaxID=1406 RepID=UPI001F0E06B3|nr:hypothetical protein [Paenibacillus polymyxa]UMR34462.1 hypothetical protein MJ749_17470 [Paenibacillus polymyxa]